MGATDRRYMVCRYTYTTHTKWRVWDQQDARYVETMRADEGLTDFRTPDAAQNTAAYLNGLDRD